MGIAPTSTAPTGTAQTQTNSGDKSPLSGISSDFQTFLRMMTTQLQNQDPLNPMESSEFALQIATFAGVEQQTQTNKLLEGLWTEFGVMGLSQMAGWVGQEARSTAPVFADDNPVTLVPEIPKGATKVTLAVYGKDNKLVMRKDIPPGSKTYEWEPEKADGSDLPAGTYTFKIESFAGEKSLGVKPVEAFGEIQEVRNTPGGLMIVLKGGSEVPAVAISALRRVAADA